MCTILGTKPESCPEFFPRTDGVDGATDVDQHTKTATGTNWDNHSPNSSNKRSTKYDLRQNRNQKINDDYRF